MLVIGFVCMGESTHGSRPSTCMRSSPFARLGKSKRQGHVQPSRARNDAASQAPADRALSYAGSSGFSRQKSIAYSSSVAVLTLNSPVREILVAPAGSRADR